VPGQRRSRRPAQEKTLNLTSPSHAVLDVFDQETLPASSPFWARPDVTVLPHISAPADRESAAQVVADNIGRYRRGERIGGQRAKPLSARRRGPDRPDCPGRVEPIHDHSGPPHWTAAAPARGVRRRHRRGSQDLSTTPCCRRGQCQSAPLRPRLALAAPGGRPWVHGEHQPGRSQHGGARSDPLGRGDRAQRRDRERARAELP
jgi:D-isomer specific 2-hydroxyacid dehydrogenase, NAD binding domain